jgi:hypothetical protein
MSKVNNIKKHLLPFLTKVLDTRLSNVSNLWFEDIRNNLFKLNIFEDGYMISSNSDYPENADKNFYNNVNIYLKKVSRSDYVNNKDSLFKFGFIMNNSVYHYIFSDFENLHERFDNFQVESRKRKRKYSEGLDEQTQEKQKQVKKNNKNTINWSQMVSASRVRNYMLNDTLVDWLSEYNVNSIDADVSKVKSKSTSSFMAFKENDNIDEFTKHIMDQGNAFEKEVVKLISKKIKVVQASESFQAREIRNFNYTKKLMNDGVPVIFQAVLHDYEGQTYGCPDLIVRADHLNKLFNQELLSNEELKYKGKKLKGNHYYVVVDIKHSTLHFNVDRTTLRNKDSVPAYKGQLFIYNQALAKIQGHNPMKAFILGKMWSWKDRVGTNFLENLGTIDYSNFDNNYIQQTTDAIQWILRVRNEGHKWKLQPLPSIPELYPNMNNERDGVWHGIKKQLADSINEITSLWMCGVKNRITAHNNMIYSYKDKDCCAELLGFKKGKVSKTLDQIIEINRRETTQVLPSKISLENIGTKNWRNIHENSLEFYLDFETMNSNLGKVLVEDQNIGYMSDMFIFQIGLGYCKNNKWVYKSFLAEKNDIMSELKMINSFWQFVDKVKKEMKMKECHFVHWYPAEPICYRKLQQRIMRCGSKLPELNCMDLYQLFRHEPITVNGALNFSLKSIAKSMNSHKLIKTSWDSTNPCSNGLNAMLLAHKAYKDASGPLDDTNVIMHNIIHYNLVDCKVLWEILCYLRENH